MYRYLSSKKNSSCKNYYYTFLSAMIISTSDEFFQLNMTNRVFDLGDIAKDMLGSCYWINPDIFCNREWENNSSWLELAAKKNLKLF